MPEPETLLKQLKNHDHAKTLTREETRQLYRSKINLEILDKLNEEKIKSIRHLARRINRDRSNVKRSIKILENLDIIKLRQDTSRGAGCKIPELKHDVIIPEPEIKN